MKKVALLLFTGMLALTGCTNSKDKDMKMDYVGYFTEIASNKEYYYARVLIVNMCEETIHLDCSDFTMKKDGETYVSSGFITERSSLNINGNITKTITVESKDELEPNFSINSDIVFETYVTPEATIYYNNSKIS